MADQKPPQGENPHFVRDALGRPLNIGDKLVMTNGEPAMYTIVDIKPFLHPKAPPGALLVVFQNTFKMACEDGSVLENFLRTMTAQEQAVGEGRDQLTEGGQGGGKGSLLLTDLPKGKPS
jgi:hypothetical protein